MARAGPNDHMFSTRTSDDGKTTVIFGDGRHGARVPSGLENVVATYRTRPRRASVFTRRPPDAIELGALYDGLKPGRWLVVGGDRTDIPSTTVPGGERVEKKRVPQQRGSAREARDNAQIEASATRARRRPRRAPEYGGTGVERHLALLSIMACYRQLDPQVPWGGLIHHKPVEATT